MNSFLHSIWEVLNIIIVAVLIVLPIRYFLFQPFLVKGQSMEPNFENGDYLIIDELSYRLRQPERGEVIVFKYPKNPSLRYIKRIIGLPGETVEIENGKITILNEKGSETLNESQYLSPFLGTPGNIKVTLGKNEYFVLGDNRPSSSDSRSWGLLPRKNIIGRVFVRAWPFAALAKFEPPIYNEP